MFKTKILLLTTMLIANLSLASDIEEAFNNTVITVDQHKINSVQLNQYAQNKIKRRFYHGKPPEKEQQTFMLGIADSLVEQHLLAREAKRRNIEIDQKKIDLTIAAYQQANQDKPDWEQAQQHYVPMHKQMLTEAALVEALQQQINQQAQLSPVQIKQFYQQHPEKFTQPAQVRASIILLSVASNASGFVWQAAGDQANNIMTKLDNGEDFATLAELHSTDITADQGGDMGFLHQGMAAARAEQAMKLLTVGQVSKPVMLLEGIAIFKLTDSKPPQLHSFDEVETRAGQLANKEARDSAWDDLKQNLRAKAKINIDKSKLLFL